MSKKTVLKLGLICAIGFGLWRLWENDAAINAVILFCTAGVVPGTNTVLTPEQVYIVLGTVLCASLMLIFAKEVKRDVRAIRTAWHHWRQKGGTLAAAEEVAQSIVADAEAAAEQAPIRLTPSRRSARTKKTTAAGLPVAAVAAAATSGRPAVVIPVQKGPGLWQRIWAAVRPRLIIALGATLEAVLKAADHTVVWASRRSLQAYGAAAQGWRWLEPRLRRFDALLERKLKANKDVAALLHFLGEAVKLANARMAELRARFTRIHRAPEE
jgi:hypothetical protein